MSERTMTVSDPTAEGVRFEHPSAEDLAAYLSAALPAPEALRLETHLSDCWPCRQEVIGARRLLRSPRPDRRWVLVPAAAAAILALLLLRPGPTRPTGQQALRADGNQAQEFSRTLDVVSPTEGDTANVGGAFLCLAQRAGRASLSPDDRRSHGPHRVDR